MGCLDVTSVRMVFHHLGKLFQHSQDNVTHPTSPEGTDGNRAGLLRRSLLRLAISACRMRSFLR